MLIAIAVVVCALVISAAFEVFWPLTVVLAATVSGLWWVGQGDTLSTLLQPWYLAAYFPIGFAWVFFKWTRLVEASVRSRSKEPPEWSRHWEDFIAHFFYWPVSMLAYLLSDVLREAWRLVSRMVAQSFDRYAQWRFRSVRHD
jgi:hypothetical protein